MSDQEETITKIIKKMSEKEIEEESFYDEINKDFGIDKKCLINVDKIYNLTVSTNMMITLFATLVMVWIGNSINLLDYQYTTANLFLTTIVLFTLWNIILGYSYGNDKYSISTNTSLLISVLILPFVAKGPTEFIKQFC